MAGQRRIQWMSKLSPPKMQEPPKTMEEFLKSQNWDCWPREISWTEDDEWMCTLKNIKEDSSFNSIYTQLWNNVPRIFETITIMDSRLKDCSLALQHHASKLFEQSNMISKTSSYENLKRYKAFLKKYSTQKKIMLSDGMETEKNIEGFNFSGFKANELTELPRHLDAKRVYLFILKAYNFDQKVFRIWKTHFLSEASIALLHDCFWWWFLYKFKPHRKDQDCLFDRIAESYVTLFMSIPLSRKDAFFQVFPDCLTQAIYATFLEAFPESSNIFNDQFKEDLGNNIFLWFSGLKPQRGFWTHWKLTDLSSTSIHGSRKSITKSLQERITRSHERILANIDFDMTKILKNPRAWVTSTFKEDSSTSAPTVKSHYSSLGPEFYRVLFHFGGQSPMILYYLKMHQLEGISKTPKQKKATLTEILQEPTQPAPTYCDIIKEAKRQFTSNRRDFRMEMQRINEEIKLLRQEQDQINKEVERLQAKATKKPLEASSDFEKFLHKLHVDAKLNREYVTSMGSSSSATTEECESEEEEHEEKPKVTSTQE